MERIRKNAGLIEVLFYMFKCSFVIIVLTMALKDLGELLK